MSYLELEPKSCIMNNVENKYNNNHFNLLLSMRLTTTGTHYNHNVHQHTSAQLPGTSNVAPLAVAANPAAARTFLPLALPTLPLLELGAESS